MAATTLQGRRIAFLATDGVEEVEYVKPRQAVERAGATVELVSLKPGLIQSFNHLDHGRTYGVDVTVADADAGGYDALVLPGGVANPDFLRTDADAVRFVKAFFDAGKPVGVICHGPWTLIEADVVRGRRITSWPSLRTDLTNAGATWLDEPVVTDNGLVSSRKPADLPAFCTAIIEEFGAPGRG
ncbi:type 1 glutamine amidotransferase domain-containing protein [Micromonospora purpureochromogenes]|uniref:type 1 glutamine amidotransferase domain-containing protein n=1 Tax=Micromonospora purpureochromogenes TaxID=47872 RepID=UPI003403B514